jgi:hypothetical protein
MRPRLHKRSGVALNRGDIAAKGLLYNERGRDALLIGLQPLGGGNVAAC